jgi:hypothetical protein
MNADLHCIWTLPENDGDYSVSWNLFKGHFSRSIADGERISKNAANAVCGNAVFGAFDRRPGRLKPLC